MTSLSFLVLSNLANADYVTPEKNIEIGEGVLARASAALEIKNRNITGAVIDLYNQKIENISSGITLVSSDDNCIFLYINTRGGIKNFINQIIFEEEKCIKH